MTSNPDTQTPQPITRMKRGQKGKIVQITNKRMAVKLMTMGILPGVHFEVVNIAPLRSGVHLNVGGYNIGLRFDEASQIMFH